MLIRIREIVKESPPVAPKQGSKYTDPTIFWRMVVVPADDESGAPKSIVVRGSGGPRGRRYAAGQEYELSLEGRDTEDRDGSIWAQARLALPGQASGRPQGSGGGSSASGAGQGASGGQKASSGGYQRVARPMPRDIYFQRFATLYFEAATAFNEELVKWERTGNVEHPNPEAFWTEIGKVANQAAMSMGLECLPVSEAQKKRLEEEARLRAEAEIEEKRKKEEEEARKRLAEEEMSRQEMDWG